MYEIAQTNLDSKIEPTWKKNITITLKYLKKFLYLKWVLLKKFIKILKKISIFLFKEKFTVILISLFYLNTYFTVS